MTLANIIFNVITVFLLISLINMIRYTIKVRKVLKENKDNPNMKGISIVNGEIKIIEDNKQNNTDDEKKTHDLVKDIICGKEIDKSEAYRILREGKEYFFCSWECRQQFLEGK